MVMAERTMTRFLQPTAVLNSMGRPGSDLVEPAGVVGEVTWRGAKRLLDAARCREQLDGLGGELDAVVERLHRRLERRIDHDREFADGFRRMNVEPDGFEVWLALTRSTAEVTVAIAASVRHLDRRQQARWRLAGLAHRLLWGLVVTVLLLGSAADFTEGWVLQQGVAVPDLLVGLLVAATLWALVEFVASPMVNAATARWWWRAVWEQANAVLGGLYFAGVGLASLDDGGAHEGGPLYDAEFARQLRSRYPRLTRRRVRDLLREFSLLRDLEIEVEPMPPVLRDRPQRDWDRPRAASMLQRTHEELEQLRAEVMAPEAGPTG